jgi:galactose-1-phosphate uridylyltransferase
VSGAIEFRAERKTARLHDPRRGFALAAVESEIRYHPLTGDTARICHFSLAAPPPVDLGAMVEASRGACPFCPGKVEGVTPRFPEDIVPGGRVRHGEAVLFPNLFPYDDLSAIAVPCGEHFLAMDAIAPRVVADGLGVARDFMRIVAPRFAPGTAYGIVTWNYMPPSGGTQVHPHLQVIVTENPGNGPRRELAAAAVYRARRGRAFAADLIDAERGGSRWIGERGRVAWLVPFAPTGVLGDAMAVFRERTSLLDLDDADISAFAESLARVLAGFAARGLWSFNLCLQPDAFGESSGRHWLAARLVPRLYLNPTLRVVDVAYLPLLLEERFAMSWPEEVAAALRTHGL